MGGLNAKQQKGLEVYKDLCGQIAIITNDETFKRIHGFSLNNYLSKRDNFARTCEKHAEHIEEVVKNAGIAKTAAGGVGIASGAAAIGGIVAAPFTAGLSLTLTVGGIAGGVASAATSVIADLAKDSNIKEDEKAIKDGLAELDLEEKTVCNLFQKK